MKIQKKLEKYLNEVSGRTYTNYISDQDFDIDLVIIDGNPRLDFINKESNRIEASVYFEISYKDLIKNLLDTNRKKIVEKIRNKKDFKVLNIKADVATKIKNIK